jgi:hypothetical protein
MKMRKIPLVLILLFLCRITFAHNPQVSTISIIQQQDKKWSVFITAPLYTCQLAIAANFPNTKIDSLNVLATQDLISALVKNNLIINDNRNIKLTNSKIQVAHEITIYFDIADTIIISKVDFKAFSKLREHFTLFKLIPFNKKEITYVLQSDNEYIYETTEDNNKIGKDYLFGVRYILIALIISVILYMIFNKLNKYRRIQ